MEAVINRFVIGKEVNVVTVFTPLSLLEVHSNPVAALFTAKYCPAVPIAVNPVPPLVVGMVASKLGLFRICAFPEVAFQSALTLTSAPAEIPANFDFSVDVKALFVVPSTIISAL